MSRRLFIDFETYFDSASGYTLKKMSMLEYIRDPRFKVFGLCYRFDNERSHWLSGDHAIRSFFSALNWGELEFISHNVKFDGAIAAWHYGVKPFRWVCTQAMARGVLGYTVKSHSLAALAEYFGLQPKGHLNTDGLQELSPAEERELAEYCVHDNDLCAEIFERLSAEFPAGQYSNLDWTIRAFVDPMLELDEAKLTEINTSEKARRENIFVEIGIEKDVFASNKEFPKLLESRGFEVPLKKNPKGLLIPALAIGDEGFRELMETENDELRELITARMAAKSCALETRSEKYMNLARFGPWPFDVQFAGAHTKRYSGSNGAGGNPQNLHSKGRGQVIRSAVVAPKGYKMIVADFSTVELRLQAWLAKEPTLIPALVEGRDPYCDFGTRFYRRPITKADEAERKFSKEAVLGLGYAMGKDKFKIRAKIAAGAVISLDESKRAVELYRTTFKGIPELWSTLDQIISLMARGTALSVPGFPFLQIKKQALVLPSGLRLLYPNLRVEEGERNYVFDKWSKRKYVTRSLYGGKFLENICQALAGVLCWEAIQRAEAWGVRCFGQVHDEIIAIVPEEREAEGIQMLRRAMTVPPSWWPQLRLKAEVGSGANWLEAKKAAK